MISLNVLFIFCLTNLVTSQQVLLSAEGLTTPIMSKNQEKNIFIRKRMKRSQTERLADNFIQPSDFEDMTRMCTEYKIKSKRSSISSEHFPVVDLDATSNINGDKND